MDNPRPEDDLRILAERARILAREIVPEPDPRDSLEVVAFQLSGKIYGLELRRVREVAALRDLTPAPGCPECILGIVNLRGEIQTVIDLKPFFDLPGAEITETHRLIMLDDAEARLGILADAVLGVRRVPKADLQISTPGGRGSCADYRTGITPDGLVLLDAKRILEDPRIVVDDGAPPGSRHAACKPPGAARRNADA